LLFSIPIGTTRCLFISNAAGGGEKVLWAILYSLVQ